jgi:hypothetical protein
LADRVRSVETKTQKIPEMPTSTEMPGASSVHGKGKPVLFIKFPESNKPQIWNTLRPLKVLAELIVAF